LPLGFLVRIPKAPIPARRGAEKMFMIMRRPYACLEKELKREFRGEEDVRVIADRRLGERRKSLQPSSSERGLADSRSPGEGLVDLST